MVAGEIRYPFGGELRFKLEEPGRLLTFVVSALRPAALYLALNTLKGSA